MISVDWESIPVSMKTNSYLFAAIKGIEAKEQIYVLEKGYFQNRIKRDKRYRPKLKDFRAGYIKERKLKKSGYLECTMLVI
jgi:hypothetical protein